jgi:septation ring formation regulator EzrA
LEEIKRLNKEYTLQFQKKYFSFKTEIGDLENKIIASGVQEKLKYFSSKLEDTNIKIEKIGNEVSKLKDDDIKTADIISALTSDIESSISEIFGEEIRINA